MSSTQRKSPSHESNKKKTRRVSTKNDVPVNLYNRNLETDPIKELSQGFVAKIINSAKNRFTRRKHYLEGDKYATNKKKEKVKTKGLTRTKKTVTHFFKKLKDHQLETERKCYRYLINWITIENLIFYEAGQQFVMDVPPDSPEDPCSNYLVTNCPDKIGKIKCIPPPNKGPQCIDEQRKAVLQEGHVIKDRYANKPYKIEQIDTETGMFQFIYRNNTLYVVIRSGSIIKNLYEDDTTMMIVEDIVKALNQYLAKDRKKRLGLFSSAKVKKVVFGGHSYGCVCSLLILRNHLIALNTGSMTNRINMDLSKIFVVGSAPFPWLKPEEQGLFTEDVLTRVMIYSVIQNFGRYLPDFNGVDRFVYGITSFHDYVKYEKIRDDDDDDSMPDGHTLSPTDKVIKLVQLPMRFLYYTASKSDIAKALNDIDKRNNLVKSKLNYDNYVELPHNRSISINSLNTQHPVLELKDVDFVDPEFMREYNIVSLNKSMKVNALVTEYTHSWACYRNVLTQFVKTNTNLKPQSTPNA